MPGEEPADWLERVIVEPDKLTAEKDPVQLELVKKYGYEMPNLGISRDDARKIIAYLAEELRQPPCNYHQECRNCAKVPARRFPLKSPPRRRNASP